MLHGHGNAQDRDADSSLHKIRSSHGFFLPFSRRRSKIINPIRRRNMSDKEQIKQGQDIVRLQEQVEGIRGEISEIKNNHLTHLVDDVKELKDGLTNTNLKIAKWSGGGVAILGLLQIILKFIN